MNSIINFSVYINILLSKSKSVFNCLPKALSKGGFIGFKACLLDIDYESNPVPRILIGILYVLVIAVFKWNNVKKQQMYGYYNPLINSKSTKGPFDLQKALLDSDRFRNVIDKFTTLNISPAEYNRLIREPQTGMNIFRLVFLDLIRRNIIFINEHTLSINIDRVYLLKHYEHKFIQILLRHMNFRDEGIYQTISLVDFINHLVAQHGQVSLSSAELMELLNCDVSGELLKDEILEKDAKFLKNYYKKQHLIQDIKYDLNFLKTSYDILEHYSKYHNINPADLYALASATPISHDKISMDHFNIIKQEKIDLKKFYYEVGYILDISAARIDPDAAIELTLEK